MPNIDATKGLFEPIKEERETPSTNKHRLEILSSESPPRFVMGQTSSSNMSRV